jgi:hypothetical protein
LAASSPRFPQAALLVSNCNCSSVAGTDVQRHFCSHLQSQQGLDASCPIECLHRQPHGWRD